MNLLSQLTALQEQTRGLIPVGRATLCFRLAKQLEKAGEYDAACEALSEFWPKREGPPKLDELDEQTKAEVLLRVGSLAGWLGSVDQAEGSQETAKNLITQSVEAFQLLGQLKSAAEARADLALCYWREGAFDEARIHLDRALELLKDDNSDLKACVLIRAGMVEATAGRLNEALRFYDSAAAVLEESTDHALKGAFHNQLALLYKNLGTAEPKDDYKDRALIEYAAASFHFEQAGHTRFQACVDINLGFLFGILGRFAESHRYLDRARSAFLESGDHVHLAQVNDTRARTLLAEGRTVEAERFARQAVKTLEKGGEQALLAEALTTHGTALARLGNYSRSKALLERAIEVAETAGDLEGSGRAKLSIIEELGEQTSARELASIYESAVSLLEQSQDPSAKKRLVSCARAVIDALTKAEDDPDSAVKEHSWEGFSFRQEVVKIERALIERALRDTGGSVTKASRLLGFKHHQSLIALINTRHKNLLNTRSAIRKRRHHIFSRPRRIPRKVVKPNAERANSQISILHVEDNKLIAKLVDDMCAPEDWRVELSVDGDSALRKLTGNDHYDLLVVDNDLPGLSGLELVQRARKMTHHRRTPIVMLSGSDCETEAWGAGVDAFLKKPEQIKELTSTIARLLVNGHEHA
jgi:CheY-like chemotaxis protein/tetratricopeptide (TPR) repeat protein